LTYFWFVTTTYPNIKANCKNKKMYNGKTTTKNKYTIRTKLFVFGFSFKDLYWIPWSFYKQIEANNMSSCQRRPLEVKFVN
jgi:hypothetical protein